MPALLSRRRLAQFIAAQLVAGSDRAKLLQQVAAYLVVHKQVKQAELLVQDIADILSREHATVTAEVISARALSAELRAAISQFVSREHQATAVQINETIDTSIIGGVIVKTPGFEFDNSIRTKLNRLRSA